MGGMKLQALSSMLLSDDQVSWFSIPFHLFHAS